MTISGINGTNTQTGQMGMGSAADSYSRNIQNQISNAQKQLQELSSNEEMTAEEKTKKRQEIQQQINDLNTQLRQHQAQQRKAAGGSKKQQDNRPAAEGTASGTGKAGNRNTGLSQTSMTAILSADNSMKQAKVQGSMAKNLEGRAGVLKAEIKSGNGGSAEKKEAALADIEQKAQTATSSQLSTLADANRTLEEAAAESSEAEAADSKPAKANGTNSGNSPKTTTGNNAMKKTGGIDTQENDSEKNAPGTDAREKSAADIENAGIKTNISALSGITTETAAPLPRAYKPVDIRL